MCVVCVCIRCVYDVSMMCACVYVNMMGVYAYDGCVCIGWVCVHMMGVYAYDGCVCI